MKNVLWEDTELPVRVFQLALRLATHFLERLEQFPDPAGSGTSLMEVLGLISEELKITHKQLRDRPIADYTEHLRARLGTSIPVKGYGEVIGGMVADLASPFGCEDRLVQLNRRAFEALKICIDKWGEPASRERAGQMKLLPIRCQTPLAESPILSFVRQGRNLLLRPGSADDALWECIILEFSLFHEYLSHYFPGWREDEEEISEGLLFALEWEWFQVEYLPFDVQLLLHQWNPRLQANREAFQFGQWLLRRECPAWRNCAAGFLLEWVAGWKQFRKDVHEDLKSQVFGIGHKLRSRMSRLRQKDQDLRRILEEAICGSCQGRDWNAGIVRDSLGRALEPFSPSD